MKKSFIFWAVFLFLIFIVFMTLLFHIVYVLKFHNNFRVPSDVEREKAVQILNKSFDLNNYELSFGEVYEDHGSSWILVYLDDDNSTIKHLVDLRREEIMKR